MRLEGKIEKLRGNIEFEFNSEKFQEAGAVLSFHERDGVSLEWSGKQERLDQLQSIFGDFIFKVYIPDIQVVHNQIDGGGAHYRGIGSKLFTSYDNPDPRKIEYDKILIQFPYLHEYVGVAFQGWKQETNNDLCYEWKNCVLNFGDSFPKRSKVSIRISAIAENDFVTGVSLRPRPEIEVDFAVPVSFDVANAHATSLRELFEMLSTRPCGVLTTRYLRDDSCIVLREPLGNRGFGTKTSHPLKLRYEHCSSYLPQMIGTWLSKIGKSPAIENLLRLLYYPDLPIDLRYFMAFSALGYLNVEQRHKGQHRAKIPEIEQLKAFNAWWDILVPNISRIELDKYLGRVANTRHNFAHLSRPDHEVLAENRDLVRGYNQLHVLARACLFKSMGLPDQECEEYIRSLTQYLDRHFGSVPEYLLT